MKTRLFLGIIALFTFITGCSLLSRTVSASNGKPKVEEVVSFYTFLRNDLIADVIVSQNGKHASYSVVGKFNSHILETAQTMCGEVINDAYVDKIVLCKVLKGANK
jgi:hypothetical protein